MINEIERQIEVINETLAWLKKHRTEQYEQRFFQLVLERCRLKKMIEAELENPAIAAYGESQKGKSYLVGNLLQDKGESFKISANGEYIDFVRKINPIGDKNEATGVVTRFTSYSNDGESRYSEKYPVMVKLLSIADVITILCDGYFKDVFDHQTYSDEEIKTKVGDIYQRYAHRHDIQASPLVEDDILNLKTYLQKFVKAESQGICRSAFFEKIALIIRKIPYTEYASVFSLLWYHNPVISAFFERMVGAIANLEFSPIVYLPIDAVLHHGRNRNTIMSVACLNGLDDTENVLTTDVFLRTGNNGFKCIPSFNKSELCAICAEAIYKVDARYLHCEKQYCLDMVSKEVKDTIAASSFTNNLLESSDLLDFPGAKNRLDVKESFLAQQYVADDGSKGASNLVQIFLRGKVAFFFNKYSDSKMVNVLLFCHDSEQVHVNSMYRTIEDWVNDNVGADIAARKKTMEIAGGIAPLFVVSTKFNVDMIHKDDSDHNTRSAMEQRWESRFTSVLSTNCLKIENVEWFNNWSGRNIAFDNCYILRDYKYSGCTGSGNNLYDGYTEHQTGSRETTLKIPQEFYGELRKSFIESPDVKRFISNPEKAWDLTATINNDGAAYIIQQLGVVASNLKVAREQQFRETLREVGEKILSIINEYYETENDDDILKQNILKARRITCELDLTCNTDNYFFGHLIQSLQISLKEAYNVVHQTIQDPVLMNGTSTAEYEILIKRFGPKLEKCTSADEALGVIAKGYAYPSVEDARKRLTEKGVDPDNLIKRKYKKRLNSYVVSDRLFCAWTEKIKAPEMHNMLVSANGVDAIVLSMLTDKIIETATNLMLVDQMAMQIAEYVDVMNVYTVNENLVADIMVDVINSFVLDLGYSYYSENVIKQCREIVIAEDLDVFRYIDNEETGGLPNKEELSILFNDITRNPAAITPSFENNYYRWIEYIFVAFIVTQHTSRVFDRKANHELSLIREKII